MHWLALSPIHPPLGNFKCVNINSLVWTLFLNQFRLSLLTSTWSESNSRVGINFYSCSIWVQIIHLQNHTSLLDKNIEVNDLVIIFENWKLDGDNFFNKTIHSIILLLGHIREVIGGFFQDPRYLDWVATLDPVRPPPSHHHEVIFLPSPFVSCLYTFTMHWEQCMR